MISPRNTKTRTPLLLVWLLLSCEWIIELLLNDEKVNCLRPTVPLSGFIHEQANYALAPVCHMFAALLSIFQPFTMALHTYLRSSHTRLYYTGLQLSR